MNNRKFPQLLLYMLILMMVILSACAQSAETEPPTEGPEVEEPAAEEPIAEEPSTGELKKIRLSSLAIMELAPVVLAQQEGLFAKHGVEVEIIPVSSGQEKDQLMAVGEAECGIGEHLTLLLSNQETTLLQFVIGTNRPNETHPVFTIIAGANSGIENLEGVKGIEIATSEGTVNEFVATRILQRNGFSDEDIKFLGVPRIPDRIALLNSGEIKAATFPTNLGLMAAQEGAIIVADDGKYPELMEGGWVCRKDFIDENPEAIQGFVNGWVEGVEMYNEDPQNYKSIAVENNLIPKPIVESYIMPTFPGPFIPSEVSFQDMYQWALEKGIVTNENIAYEDTIRPEFLP